MFARQFATEDRADCAVCIVDRQLDIDLLSALQRRSAELQQLLVQRLVEPVVLRRNTVRGDLRADFRAVEDRREVEALRFPLVDRLTHIEQVAAADHLIERAEAHLRHVLAHLLGDEAEEVDDVLRPSLELLAQLRVLRGDAHGAGVEMADAHHDAAHDHERRGREAVLLRSQQRCDHDIAAGLHLAVRLDDDAVAQVVQHESLLRFREAELPGDAGMLDRRKWACAGAAVVAADEDDVRLRLRHTGGDRADADLSDQLHTDAGARVRVLEVMYELRQVLDRVDVVVRRRADQPHVRRRVAHGGDPWVDLGARELAAFARLGALRHLDLQLV